MVPDDGALLRTMENKNNSSNDNNSSTLEQLHKQLTQPQDSVGDTTDLQQEPPSVDNRANSTDSPAVATETDADMKAPTQQSPDPRADNNINIAFTNKTDISNNNNNCIDNVCSNTSNGDASSNVLLRIPVAVKPASENLLEDGVSNSTCATTTTSVAAVSQLNGPDLAESLALPPSLELSTLTTEADAGSPDSGTLTANVTDTYAAVDDDSSKAPSRRASYIDVVGLSADEMTAVSFPADVAIANGLDALQPLQLTNSTAAVTPNTTGTRGKHSTRHSAC